MAKTPSFHDRRMLALAHHCRLGCETLHPRFRWGLPIGVSFVLTVNSGYEGIEEGYGGPVWHVSTAGHRGAVWGAATLERYARAALDSAGDPTAGEWTERHGAFHLRRRLTDAEAALVGPAVDVRGTPEQAARFAAVRAYLPPGFDDPL